MQKKTVFRKYLSDTQCSIEDESLLGVPNFFKTQSY